MAVVIVSYREAWVILSAAAEEDEITQMAETFTHIVPLCLSYRRPHIPMVYLFALLLYFSLSFWMAKHRRRDRVHCLFLVV